MTEAEWLSCDDPRRMLAFLRGMAGDRKLRLFACACCRRIWDRLPDEASRRAVEVAERYADGRATGRERKAARVAAARATAGLDTVRGLAAYRAEQAATAALNALNDPPGLAFAAEAAAEAVGDAAAEGAAQAALLRDLTHPFLALSPDPAWITPTAVSLAESIYGDRAWDRLPILADALEDAGCDRADLLGHLRGGGPHAPGCWAVDLVLGRG